MKIPNKYVAQGGSAADKRQLDCEALKYAGAIFYCQINIIHTLILDSAVER